MVNILDCDIMVSKFKLQSYYYIHFLDPVGWTSRIHQLHLCGGVRLSQWVSWVWHLTIWCWGFCNDGALRNAECPFIVITPRSSLSGSDRTVWYLNYVLILKWIAWNRTVWLFNCVYVNDWCLIELLVLNPSKHSKKQLILNRIVPIEYKWGKPFNFVPKKNELSPI